MMNINVNSKNAVKGTTSFGQWWTIIISCVVVLILMWVKMFNIITVQQAQRETTISAREYANWQVVSSTQIIYSAFTSINRVLNSITPNIHKELIKKRQYKSKNNHLSNSNIYNNYRYNYMVFSHTENTTDIQQQYSTIEDSNLNDFIMIEHYKLLLNSIKSNKALLTGQNIYKLINYKDIINVLSISLTFDKWGNITGSVVVVIRLNELMKLNDFILSDSRLNVYLRDSKGTNLYTSSGGTEIYNGQVHFLSRQSISADLPLEQSKNIAHSSNYIKSLDLMIFSYINCSLYKPQYNIKKWIILCIVLTIIIIALMWYYTLKLRHHNYLIEKVAVDSIDNGSPISKTNNVSFDNNCNLHECEVSVCSGIIAMEDSQNNLTKQPACPCDNYKKLEVTSNLLEINLSILTNQINNKRLNESLTMLKSHNSIAREKGKVLTL